LAFGFYGKKDFVVVVINDFGFYKIWGGLIDLRRGLFLQLILTA
jgi:hypothetical protein